MLFLQDYRPSTLSTGIGPAWSLSIEVVFYLALPVLAVVAAAIARRFSTRRGRRLSLLVPPVTLLLVGITGQLAAALTVAPGGNSGWLADWHSVIERSFWSHAGLFFFGMTLAILRVDSEDGLLRLPRWWRRAAVALIPLVAVPTAALTVNAGVARGEPSSYVYNTAMGLVVGLLLALVVLPARPDRQPLLVRVLESRPLVVVGVASYSVFLWHQPLLFWLDRQGLLGAGTAGFGRNLLLLSSVTGAASFLTYRYVEVPALRRKRVSGRTAEPAPAVPAYQAQAAP
jgi:peptidoglycan/LPS O-acetylase OafA/YrhL